MTDELKPTPLDIEDLNPTAEYIIKIVASRTDPLLDAVVRAACDGIVGTATNEGVMVEVDATRVTYDPRHRHPIMHAENGVAVAVHQGFGKALQDLNDQAGGQP